MSKVEDLPIVQAWPHEAYQPVLEMFKLLLEKGPLSGRFSCLLTRNLPMTTYLNDLIWKPLCDLEGFEVKASTLFPSMQPVRPLKPNPWPKLVNPELSNMPATNYDLASLMITLTPSF